MADTYCVGPTATNGGSGADWDHLKAWTDTPARGDTWYLRDGDYPHKTLNTPNGNGALITIKKATSANYTEASSTGWDPAFAGQARIAGLKIGSSHWLIDGVTGAGASVMPADITPGNYGFYINPNDNAVLLENAITDITIRHCYFYTTIESGTGIYQADVIGQNKSYITVSYCLANGWNEFIRNGSRIISDEFNFMAHHALFKPI
jgi:hypothetical protein